MPRLDREQAISVAALAALLLMCLLVAGLSIQMRSDAGSDLAERNEALSRLEMKLRAGAGRPSGTAPPTAFLDAPTTGIASAKLQAYLAQLAELQQAGIVSTATETAKGDEASDTIRVQATLDMNTRALRAVLYQLESGTPYVFVDTLTLQPADATVGHAEDPILRVTMGLRAFWRRGGP